MDAVEPLQDLDDFVVFARFHGFADQEPVLGEGAPGHAGGLRGGDGGEGLVAAEERLQGEVVVC